MASNFTVVFDAGEHFGSNPSYFQDASVFDLSRLPPGLRFVGGMKEYKFDTPRANEQEQAVLMFESFDVNLPHNLIQVNGQQIPTGIPVSSHRGEWISQIRVLEPRMLRAEGSNTLLIAARSATGDEEGNRDNFILASAVVFYKVTAD